MSNVSEWNVAASSNTSAPPNGAPEGMAPSTVNNTMREMMAALARWYQDTNGALESTGSANAYALTTNSGHAALADQPLLVFQANHTNTGGSTLNVDSLGAKSIRFNGAALGAGAITSGSVVIVAYNATDAAYDLLTPCDLPLLGSSNTFTGGVQTISAADPQLRFEETDATADNGIWDFQAQSEIFRARAINDSESSSSSWVTVNRTGTTIDSIALAGTSITLNGTNVTDYARLSLNTNKFTHTQPGFYWEDTDGTTDNQLWSAFVVSEQFRLSAVDDEQAVFTNWLTVDRTGTTIDAVNFPNGELQYGGVEVGFRGIPQNVEAGNYTLVISDAGRHIVHESGAGSGDTYTIPANSSVAFDIGTFVTFINLDSNSVSIAITTDTLTLAGTTSTGTRTLGQNGIATALKVTSASWIISGTSLS